MAGYGNFIFEVIYIFTIPATESLLLVGLLALQTEQSFRILPILMVPHSDKRARKLGKLIAAHKTNKYSKMSPVTRKRYDKAMMLFLNIQNEYDKGFYTSESCIG